MADFTGELIENVFDGPDIECPACKERLRVVAVTQVRPGSVRTSGSDGLGKQKYSVSVKTRILRFEIHHICIPLYEKGAVDDG